MRVVVFHTDESHPHATPFAYRLGRIQDGVDFLTGEERSAHDTVERLLEISKTEYPESEGYDRRVETLQDAGEDRAGWQEIKRTDGRWQPGPNAVAPGDVKEQEFSASVSSEAVAE